MAVGLGRKRGTVGKVLVEDSCHTSSGFLVTTSQTRSERLRLEETKTPSLVCLARRAVLGVSFAKRKGKACAKSCSQWTAAE